MNIKTIKRLYPEAPVFTDEIKKQKFKRIRSKTRIYIEAERHIINKEYVSVITVYRYAKDYRDKYQSCAMRYFISKDDVLFQKNDYFGKRQQYFFGYKDHEGTFVFSDDKSEKIINNLYKKYKMESLWYESPDYIIDRAVSYIKTEQTNKKRKKKAEKRKAQMKIDLKEFSDRIPSKLKKEIVEKYPVYLYEEVTDDGDKTCFCTSCKKKSKLINLDKHLSERDCPNCGKTGTVERVKQCKFEIEDHHYMIWPELKNGKVLIRFFITERYIYKNEYESFDIDIRETDREIISDYERYLYENRWGHEWKPVTKGSSNFSERAGMGYWNINNYYVGYGYLYSEGFEFMDNPKFDYILDKYYTDKISRADLDKDKEHYWVDLIENLYLLNMADVIEKFEKVGLLYLINNCYYCYDFNYKATKLCDILQLTKSAYKMFVKYKCDIYNLRNLREICKSKSTPFVAERCEKLLKLQSLNIDNYNDYNEKMVNYLVKQSDENRTVTFAEYKHYLRTIETLGYDMTKKINLYPRNFIKSDSRVSEELYKKREEERRIMVQQSIELTEQNFVPNDPRNECIKRISDALLNMKDLKDYIGGSSGLVIKVPETYKDLELEGINLANCIGNYIDKVARGETFIFFIRKIEDIDRPYFAMEYRNGKIQQIHGFANCNANKVVYDFCQKLAFILQTNKFDPKQILAAA